MRTSFFQILPALLLPAFVLTACNTDKAATDSQAEPADPSNRAPSAKAGPDQTLAADSTVSLTGAGSVDPDGDALTYAWSFDHVPEGSTITEREAPFSDNRSTTAVATTFMPDKVGTYVIALTVTDAKGLSSGIDYVIITADAAENIPIANAGPDQSAPVTTAVTLNGASSYDPVGRPLTYVWTVVDKPTNSTVTGVSDRTAASPTLALDAKGSYILSLVVNNGLASSNADEITVTATADDAAPTANAGPDQPLAQDCTTLTLDCSGSSDPDGDPMTYSWTLQGKPASSATSNATFSDRTEIRPTFYPDVAGSYVFSCAVNDGTNWSVPDTMNVTAAERTINSRPVVNAGADQAIDAGTAVCVEDGYVYDCDECTDKVVTLGGDATVSDPDGDPITLIWTVESGDATITDPSSLSTTITLEKAEPTEPATCEEIPYTVKLTVTDCTGAVSTDTIKFMSTCCGVADTSSR